MPRNFAEVVDAFLGFINLLIPLIFGLALLVIIWKLMDAWIIHAGESGKVEEGKKYALWGVLVLVVMSSIWGIVALLRSSLFN